MEIKRTGLGEASERTTIWRPWRLWGNSWLMGVIVTASCASPMHLGPPAVIEAFYKAATEGNYNEAKQYFSPTPVLIEGKILEPLTGTSRNILLEAPRGEPKALLDKYTRSGALASVVVEGVTIMGDTASCRVQKEFKDGTRQHLTIELVRHREDGKWKIVWATSSL